MNKANKTLFVIFSIVLVGAWSTANAQVVYFNGLGRALVTAESLNGNVLKGSQYINSANDTIIIQTKDTTSKRKTTDGYSVFDLGVNAQPNESLRASAVLRVKNAFGGFYGDGSSIIFRQIRLDGIVAKKVKYEIGDIDLEMSPYTLTNFNENYRDYEADVFALRRSVVEYENFNFGNKWRMQGLNLGTSFRFNKFIEKISISGFATRIRKTNYLTSPDRLMLGGRVEILQSKYFSIGGNYVLLGDLAQTAADTLINYRNEVKTLDIKAMYGVGKIEFGLNAEFGNSHNAYFAKGWKDTLGKDEGRDFFYDAGLFVRYKPLNIKLTGSYREVGYYFTSPGAQTRRIYDIDGPLNSMFPTLVNAPAANVQGFPTPGVRGANILDRMSEQDTRNTSIQTTLINFLPQYNNITPYGQATPNRKGMTIALAAGDADKLIKADVIMDNLGEIVAEGSSDKELRQFMGLRGGALFNVHKLLRWEKALALSGGMRYEKTTRGGVNDINFSSSIIDAGITFEVVKQLDLIAGYKFLTAKGNEEIAMRDNFNIITSYRSIANMDETQGLLAYGIRYRFSKNTYFTAQGINSENKFTPGNTNYYINQLFLNYTMIF